MSFNQHDAADAHSRKRRWQSKLRIAVTLKPGDSFHWRCALKYAEFHLWQWASSLGSTLDHIACRTFRFVKVCSGAERVTEFDNAIGQALT